MCNLSIEILKWHDIIRLSNKESEVMEMYGSAIVNELGHMMFWIDELRPDQITCLLDCHLEWSVKCVEI